MKLWVVTFVVACIYLNKEITAFSCAPPEFRGTTPCETPKCCNSGHLTTEVCSGCLTCAQAEDEECGGGFEAYQPTCGAGLSCFNRCQCKTKPTAGQAGSECVFPFKYKGTTYKQCTKVDSEEAWCAFGIEANTEVPPDGLHWGDCSQGCPGTDFECDDGSLFNQRGTCVPKIQEHIRIARPYSFQFNQGDQNTTAVQKCSDLTNYEYENIKKGRCYCLPAKGFSSSRGPSGEEQLGEGCTKNGDEILEALGIKSVPVLPPGVIIDSQIAQRPKGWCYLNGVKDPRYYNPGKQYTKGEDFLDYYCYDDLQWSETEQKYWSTKACEDAPISGVPAR